MKSSFEDIIFEDEVSQSEVFGKQYKEYLGTPDTSTFSGSLITDISDLLNNIILKYSNLTAFQKKALFNIFQAFNNIRTKIDPKRLKAFEHYMNEDDELLLYRNSDKGLTNIIINPDECIAFSFISREKNERRLDFYEEGDDFESLSYHFFTH